ncbi:MAG: hypothetical protein KatS3mg006_0325 [Pyrinomonadaceae bacterium]|jgi:hypothetical protein|nr:MAG: hypothetical protein KatS3mg006_0325 [Pyrinomonadaceae bacterium]
MQEAHSALKKQVAEKFSQPLCAFKRKQMMAEQTWKGLENIPIISRLYVRDKKRTFVRGKKSIFVRDKESNFVRGKESAFVGLKNFLLR